MNKEIISSKQYTAILSTFLLGSAIVLGIGSSAGRDVWIAVLIAILISVPFYFIYARILTLFPGMGLFDIIPLIFGKIVSKIFAIMIVWFAFQMGAKVVRNFTEFIRTVALLKTPQYIIAFPLILLSIWVVKAGVEVLGRWTAIVFPIMIFSIIAITFFLIPILEFKNIKPVLYEGMKPVMSAAYSVFAFPFGEALVMTAFTFRMQQKKSIYKAFFFSLLIAGATILVVTVRSLLSLGEANVAIHYFSSYASVRLVSIGEFFQRIEVTVAILFLLGGFVKTGVCLYATSRGLASVLNISNYRLIVAPVGLLMMLLSTIIFNNTMEMFFFAENIYKFYAVPFEIIIPFIIYIGAEIKARSMKKQEKKHSRK